MRTPMLAVTSVLAFGLLSAPAYLQEKGGEEETGPYEVVPNWPQPWSQQGYIWGSQPGIFAESPSRIFIVARGELKLPPTLGRGFNGMWGSTGERATVPPAEMRNCIVVVDGSGKLVESWTQWDHLFTGGGPHKVKISPYDPEHHVWVVNDSQHQIYEFSNDGKRLVMTLGERGVAGEDDKHFGQPQDIAWLPDGSILVADGLRNARVVKLDRNGTFVTSWGTKGSAPGQFSGLHGIETDKSGKVYVADRSNRRIQIFDQNGKLLDLWPGLRQANHIVVTTDQNVWVADGSNARLLKFDPQGKLLYYWGAYGTYPGAWWELHQFSVDSEGNLYGADSFNGRAQKFRPKPGADKSRLMGQMVPLMTKAAR
jgi:NHL repeat